MYLFFDTETTGLPRNWGAEVSDLDNWPRLVQLAWLEYDNSEKQISGRDYIIKPEGFTIPAESAGIHGISTERAIKEGIPLRTVLAEFSKAVSRSKFLVAHNISFDEKIVGAEFLRKDIQSGLFQTERICTKELSTGFCQIPNPHGYGGYKWPTLAELYRKLFDSDFEDIHNAKADVKACADCFFELKRRGIIEI